MKYEVSLKFGDSGALNALWQEYRSKLNCSALCECIWCGTFRDLIAEEDERLHNEFKAYWRRRNR
jgi:hypothetical protein